MGLKLDIYAGAALALVVAGVVLDRKLTAAGGASGVIQDAVFSPFVTVWNSVGNGPDPTPGNGAIPDQTTLNKSNATASDTINSILSGSLTMQSIGM